MGPAAATAKARKLKITFHPHYTLGNGGFQDGKAIKLSRQPGQDNNTVFHAHLPLWAADVVTAGGDYPLPEMWPDHVPGNRRES